ncbi:MAG TPA: hypothetical protein VEX18_16035, partial [Polyangiaceae bacterium]|nr:hypothetical protein [Polyangiaceae bacterium]
MRASLLVCGCFVTATLFAQACGDDAQRRVAQGQSGAGGEGAGAAASDSGGGSSEPVAGSGGSNGGGEAMAGSIAMGGREDCLIGPEEDQPDAYLYEFQSGTRLQARYYEVPELGPVFAGFFDSELGEWCDFLLASDDTLRCLPRSTESTEQLGYADALCQDDVWT